MASNACNGRPRISRYATDLAYISEMLVGTIETPRVAATRLMVDDICGAYCATWNSLASIQIPKR